MLKIVLLTDDSYLYKKAEHLLADKARLFSDISDADVTARDITAGTGRYLEVVSAGGTARLALPATLKELTEALTGGTSRRLTVLPEERVCFLDSEKIRLTDTEAELLDMLYRADGFVSREEISRHIFPDAKGTGAINVYIHYLREKLERRGERVVISSRNEGYKIDDKFRRGEKC